MWRVVFFLLILLMPFHEAYGQIRSFEHISGPMPQEMNEDKGVYVEARPVGKVDTMRLWIEHINGRDRPSYDKAKEADLVIWCYPRIYSHDKHILPKAGKVAVKGVHQGKERYLLILDLNEYNIPDDDQLRELFMKSIK